MARTTSSYKFERSGDEFLFKVVAAENRVPVIRRLFLAFVISALLGYALSFKGDLGFLMGCALFVGLYIGIGKFIVAADKKHRGQGGSFKASHRGVVLSNGEEIPVERIHRLILRNSFSDVSVPLVTGGTGMVGAMSVGLGQAAIADQNRNIAIGYKLVVEFGGSARTLASGLTETTAYGLMKDVGGVLGLTAK